MTLAALHPAGDFVSDEIRRTGQPYELDVLEEIARRLEQRAPGTIVDVGAHIGNHTAWLAARLPDHSIEAYEPWPTNFELLARNTVSCRNVRLHRLALSDRRGGILLGRWDDNAGHVAELHDTASAAEWVNANAAPLDAQGLANVRLIKIDVEGHEAQVLAGAAETIERDRPVIVLEDWELDVEYPPGYVLRVAWPNQQTYLLEPI